MIAAWALNLAAGKLLVTLQVLLALRTGKLEFTHKPFNLVSAESSNRWFNVEP
jgi:hypothetical protein